MKKYYFLTFALVAALFSSCTKEDNGNEPEFVGKAGEVAYVLTQGNSYNNIEGGLNVVDLKGLTCDKNVFKTTNKRSLGATPQCGVAYGSKIYVGTSESQTIEIMDRTSYLSYKQIQLSKSPEHGTQPYSMVAHDGKVFISMFDGKLARLDTLTMTIDKSVEVGPNPDQIALYNGKIYVPVSDGMNYPNYGTTAVTVDPTTMKVEKRFTVGLNPASFFVASDRLFLLCRGNYADVASALYEVSDDLKLTQVCEATLAVPFGNRVAIINEPFTMGESVVEYRLYDVDKAELADWNIKRPDYANQIFYDKRNNRLLITSYVMNGMYPSYELPGYVNVYDGTSFELLKRLDLGSAGPACIFTFTK